MTWFLFDCLRLAGFGFGGALFVSYLVGGRRR